MPVKHVRFAPEVPSTPSPSYSVSSLPSSSGPQTPPPILQYGSPYQTKPLPNLHTEVHPVLRKSPSPYLNYDMSCHPSTVTPAHASLSRSVLQEPATRPHLRCIHLISTYLPWRLTITPSSGSFVTVSDVFEGLYCGLRLAVTETEFNELPSPEAQRRVNDAYRRRFARILDVKAHELEKAKGLKRIDFFAERHHFLGLSSTSSGPHVWMVNVS